MPITKDPKVVEKAVRRARRGVAEGAKAKAEAANRATGSRAEYKVRSEALDAVLAILTEQEPGKVAAKSNGKSVPKKPLAKAAPKTAAKSSSSAAKTGVAPRPKGKAAPKAAPKKAAGGVKATASRHRTGRRPR